MYRRFDPRRWSLGIRLTAYVFGATTVILCIVGWVLYQQLTHQLWEKDEANIRSIMDIESAIVRAMDAGEGPDRWQKEWAEHTERDKDLSLRLIAPDGHVFSVSPNMPIPVDAFPAPKSRPRVRLFVLRRGSEPGRYMLAASLVATPSGSTWQLQAAYDVTESQELIETFGRRLLVVVGAAMMVACAVAAYLVHRGLRPLRVMTEVIGSINASKLDARIDSQVWPADLRLLAQSFDAMLCRLQAAFDQLSRFSSDLAHEFRSPITNLVAAAGVMLSRERSIGEYQDTLAVVVEEGDRLSRMVSSMLFLARADEAKQVLNFESISLKTQLEQIAEAYEAVADEHGVTLEVAGEGWVSADPMLLRNALSNLVSNALHHTAAGGRISLTAESFDDGVEIAVSDTGCGIDAEHLPHIFERFYRVDTARSSGDRTGLGLAVVSSIAELHAGKVMVQSTPGTGSRFALWLPLRR